MATFISQFLGFAVNEVVTPGFVSGTILRIPAGSFPSAAADFINVGAGNDFVVGGGGADTVIGGSGNDTLTGGSGVGAQVFGGSGNDLIFQVNGTPEFIDGGTGVDTLNTTAFAGNYAVNLTSGGTNFAGESFINMENLIAGIGNDTLTGTTGANFINAGAGNDVVNGLGGNDTIIGGTGNDTLTGGFGAGANVQGGDGNDLIFQVNGVPEVINGGNGVDTLNTTAFAGNYLVNLATGGTNFAGESFTNMENIVAGVGNDTLIGTFGANSMNGGAGNDSMVGGFGNDFLNGSTGDDTLVGGFGRDILIGSVGDDRFDYNSTFESTAGSVDLISGFTFSTGANPNDKIDLETIDANTFFFGDQDFLSEGNGAGQLSFVDLANGNTLVRGNVDFDATFELLIEVADGGTTASFWSVSLDFV